MAESQQIRPNRLLQPDAGIGQLNSLLDHTVNEGDLLRVLRKYNLREGLIYLGQCSYYIFKNPDAEVGKAAYRDPATGVLVSQFCLAYMANLLIISGTNDYKRELLRKPDNVETLCNIYGNYLVDPAINSKKEADHDWLKTLMVHMYYEQMPSFQYNVNYMMARAITIFRDIAPHIARPNIEALPKVLQQESGLDPMDYLRLGFIIFTAAGKNGACFNTDYLTSTTVSRFKAFMTEDNVRNFLTMVSTDYEGFRELDNEHNKELDPKLTKYRFNPLFVYPVVKTQIGNKPYIIPSVPIYLRKAYLGLFWWYHYYFERRGKAKDFRDYFGDLFQEYVGVILKEMYGIERVTPEITYGGKAKTRFIDWVVEKDDKVYLFESKASQFGLDALRIADPKVLRQEIDRKVVEAIVQVFRRIQDIDHYEELAHLRGKKIIPIIVFWDIPLIEGWLFSDWIKTSLSKIAKERNLPGLEDFKPFLLNIDDLELYDAAVDTIELEDIAAECQQDPQKSFRSVVDKNRPKGRPGNRFLSKVYEDFWPDAFGIKGK